MLQLVAQRDLSSNERIHSNPEKVSWVQINIAVQDMVKSAYPEAVEVRQAERVKAAVTKDFQAVVLSDSLGPDPAVLQVGLTIYTLLHLYKPDDVSRFQLTLDAYPY